MKCPQTKILNALKAGRSLTVLTALRLYGTTELRRVVSRLRRDGWNIASDKVRGKTYNKYCLVRRA